jgi:prepilin-type N-terminal cleavage/methylation domain-containing protein
MRAYFKRTLTRPGPTARRSRDPRSEAGFTLIEVLVTALIVALIAAGLAQALTAGADFSADQRLRANAHDIAQADQERLKSLSDQQLTYLPQTRPVTLDGETFTVISNASFLDDQGQSSCSSQISAYFQITSTVSWKEAGRAAPLSLTEETIVTRPTAGSLQADVKDETGASLGGITVTAKDQTTGHVKSAITDQNGCVVFANMPLDPFNVAATGTGYVDYDGNNPTPAQAVTVNNASIVKPPNDPFVMGVAGKITANLFKTAISATNQPSVNGYDISYFGTGGAVHMSSSADVAPTPQPFSSIATPVTLFPFWSATSHYTNNYQVWAGTCDQEQPGAPPAGTNTATVTPGSSVNATVFEPALAGLVTYAGAAVTPSDVKITFNATSGAMPCTDTWTPVSSVGTYTSGSTTYPVYPAPFASTATSGTTASAQKTTGTLTFCADYLKSGTYYHGSVGSITNTNFTAPTVISTVALTSGSATGQC